MKAFVMKWFRKSSQKRDVSQSSKSSPMMKWFNRSTVGNNEESSSSPLQNEIDVVPRTEFSASRQALNNINIALNVGESSGEASGAKEHEDSANKGCKNKYCCGADYMVDSPDERADTCEAIKNQKNSKSTLIDNWRLADNNAHASDVSTFNETDCRLTSRVIKEVKNYDYIVYFDPYAEYGRNDCPDSFYPSLVDYPTMVRNGKYVQLKSEKQRNCSQTFDLFTTSDKLKSAENDKSSMNYELLSNVESRLDESKYNLLKCKNYNKEFKMLNERFGCSDAEFWKLEDFNDDSKSTRMSDDTKTIKEFYKLSIRNHVLIHYQDIIVETGRTVERKPENVFNFFTWIILKGKEITEQHKAEQTSWIKTILNFFKSSSK